MARRPLALGLLVAALTTWGACSRSSGPPPIPDQKPVHSVSGKLLYGNQPAAGALVIFIPVSEPAENPHPRPRAEVSADGSFVLSTYGDKDGAPEGEYIVTVMWEDAESRTDRFKGRFDKSNSKFKASVKAGTNEIPAIHLK